MIAPHGYPTCVLAAFARNCTCEILSAFLPKEGTAGLFALSLFFSLRTFSRTRVNEVFRMVVVVVVPTVVPVVCELFEMISNPHCAVNCHLCCQFSTASFGEKRNGAKFIQEMVR